jgi:hypothetical protein
VTSWLGTVISKSYFYGVASFVQTAVKACSDYLFIQLLLAGYNIADHTEFWKMGVADT